MNFIAQPQKIEQQSFAIIDEILASDYPQHCFASELEKKVVTRAIHTTADFDWLQLLHFSPQILAQLVSAIGGGCTLYTDTSMALSGINKTLLGRFGAKVRCFIADADVAAAAKARGITRSMAAVEKALSEPGEKIFVVGNAPTALFALLNAAPTPRPLVIGVPVGFVGALESKQALAASDFSHITALGRKGGSNVAAAIVNALLYFMADAASQGSSIQDASIQVISIQSTSLQAPSMNNAPRHLQQEVQS